MSQELLSYLFSIWSLCWKFVLCNYILILLIFDGTLCCYAYYWKISSHLWSAGLNWKDLTLCFASPIFMYWFCVPTMIMTISTALFSYGLLSGLSHSSDALLQLSCKWSLKCFDKMCSMNIQDCREAFVLM